MIRYVDESGKYVEKKAPESKDMKKGGKQPQEEVQNLKEVREERKRIYTHNFVFVGLPNLRVI